VTRLGGIWEISLSTGGGVARSWPGESCPARQLRAPAGPARSSRAHAQEVRESARPGSTAAPQVRACPASVMAAGTRCGNPAGRELGDQLARPGPAGSRGWRLRAAKRTAHQGHEASSPDATRAGARQAGADAVVTLPGDDWDRPQTGQGSTFPLMPMTARRHSAPGASLTHPRHVRDSVQHGEG